MGVGVNSGQRERPGQGRALWQEHAVSREGEAIGLYGRGKWGEG